LKKDCNWRTALVVEELGAEICAQEKSLPIEREIISAMRVKTELEHQYVAIQSKHRHEKTHKTNPELLQLQTQIGEIDTQIAALIKEQHSYFNPIWGQIFRSGAEESYFAYQVERFACIYMEKLSDLLDHSPLTYFRANRRRLSHDPV
jgi:hypothetical protein